MRWQGCACGDEYPQYVVDSVYFSENEEPKFYFNKAFTLQCPTPDLERHTEILPDCPIGCQYFILTGNALSNGYGMHRLQVSEAERIIDPQCCGNE